MRRVRYYQFGGPEVLTLEEVEVPEVKPGQVLIKVAAVGANYVDTMIRRGPDPSSPFHRPLPGKLTGDVVGVVEQVGPDVDDALVGQRVAALVAEDAFADYALADAAWLAPAPDGLDPADASILPMSAPVALGALRAGRLAAGDTVLVHAAAGGIGHLAVRLAKLLGAGTVIATASTAAKLDFAREQGADVAIDYSEPSWPARVREAAPDGVDLVLESVGGDILRQSVALLAPLGRVVVYGAASGEFIDLPITSVLALRSVVGFSILAWRTSHPERARQDIEELTEYVADGRLRAAVHARLPLTEAVRAHELLDERANLGRVLLTL